MIFKVLCSPQIWPKLNIHSGSKQLVESIHTVLDSLVTVKKPQEPQTWTEYERTLFLAHSLK